MSQSMVFQSCWDRATTFFVSTSTLGDMCRAQHETPAGFKRRTLSIGSLIHYREATTITILDVGLAGDNVDSERFFPVL